MSFQDSAVIFFIALLLFGPRKLPELARQLGKLMGEFRRASNEFRMQMEDELRVAEQNDRQKQIAAIEAAAPAPVLPAATETPALSEASVEPGTVPDVLPDHTIAPPDRYHRADTTSVAPEPASTPEPLPIATSGDLRMMPPESGLPTPRSRPTVSDAFDSIPQAPAPASSPEKEAHA